MGKRTRPSNGGEVASRGFIFQAVVALIECLDPDNDWDQIKNEPNTDEDKVDIMLYKGGKPKSAIQVKSSINAFERADVTKWLEDLKGDAKEAENVCLYLVGDNFTPSCENYIKENPDEIKKVPFEHLQRISTGTLVGYINRVGLGEKVRVTDLDLIDASLFSEILRNSIAKEPVSRKDFETAFQRAIPQGEELEERIIKAVSGLVHKEHVIPQCLTPIPLIDKKIGLVGRDDVVKDIQKMLEENTCIVLVNGLGGIGKTAVMMGICNDLKDEGYYVAWISCGDNLQDDLLMLREALGVPKEEKADTAYSLVKAGIQQLGKKLYLFMDDLSREVTRNERDEINSLGVHVMITSRAENLPFHKKKLEYLDEESAVRVFFGYYGAEARDEETVCRIVKSVGCHTLLVELLAKAAKEEGGILEEFYEKLEKNGFFDVSEEELEAEHNDENLTIEESVIRLYKISGLSENQKRIMKLFTIFSPEKEIYYKVRDWASFDRKEMKNLVDLGWLERGGLEKGYYIHQIVKDSIARQMERNGEEVRLEDYGNFLSSVIDTVSYLRGAITYETVRERLVLTEDVAKFFDESFKKNRVAWMLFTNISWVYTQQGNYAKAMDYCRKAISINEQIFGLDHPDTAATYSSMALVYYAQDDYEKALEYYKKALVIFEGVLESDHPNIATTYSNLAMMYKEQGNYNIALEYYEKAMDIIVRIFGQVNLNTAIIYNNIAGIYRAQGKYKKAIDYCIGAMKIINNVEGPDHPYAVITYNNMAGVYYTRGDYTKTMQYFRKVLDIRKRVLGENHPDTAMAYNNLAGVYYAQGKYEKALDYFEKALAIRKRALGTNHPDTATAYYNLGGILYVQGKYEKALDYFEKALAIRKRVLGTNHPDTAMAYNNMAGMFYAQGKHEKALEYYKKTLAIQEQVLEEKHPYKAITYGNIAGVYENQGDFDKALKYYIMDLSGEKLSRTSHLDTITAQNTASIFQFHGTREIRMEFHDKGQPTRHLVQGKYHQFETAASFKLISLCLLETVGRCEISPEYHKMSPEVRRQLLGINLFNAKMSYTYSEKGRMLHAKGNYEDSLEYFRKALEIQEQVYGTNHPDTAVTYYNIALVYKSQGDYVSAFEYFGKTLPMQERLLETSNTKQ